MAERTFGEVLRDLRRRRGFSLQKLADRLNHARGAANSDGRRVGKSYLSDLERGAKPAPSRKQIDRLAEALRCSAGERDALFLAAGYLPSGMQEGSPASRLASLLGRAGVSPAARTSSLLPPLRVQDGVPVPEHDFALRADGAMGDPFQEGDVLLVRVVSDVPAGALAVYLAEGGVLVQRGAGHASGNSRAPGADSRAVAGQQGLLGQVVGFIRAL